MKKALIILAALVLLLVAFWTGLMLNFPGEAASRYVESQINRFPGVRVELAPAELGWTGLRVPSARLVRRGNADAAPLLTLTELRIPITWRLVQGLTGRAAVGETGMLHAFLPWRLGGTAEVDGRVVFGELPVPPVFQPITLQGEVAVEGRFRMDQPVTAIRQLPDGTLSLHGSGLALSGVAVGSIQVPSTRVSEVDVTATTGRAITVETFTFSGDVQGNVEGSITPNVQRPRLSVLDLRIAMAARDGWLASFGQMRPVVESFFSDGRLVVQLQGSLGRPRVQQMRGNR